jgi:hypothetical protein
VSAFTSHPHPVVAAAAERVLDTWRRRLAGHLHILTSPGYLSDPVTQLESDIAAGSVQLPSTLQQRLAQVGLGAGGRGVGVSWLGALCGCDVGTMGFFAAARQRSGGVCMYVDASGIRGC